MFDSLRLAPSKQNEEVALLENDSIDYYNRRERQELGLAETAPSAAIRKIHLTLAETYAQRAREGGAPPGRRTLCIVGRD